MKILLSGLLFAALWASASVATKFGLMSAQPLVIANIRFFIAGVLMFLFTVLLKKNQFPRRHEWKPLMIYGILNVTIYLGCFILAMQHLSAGIGSLAPALGPVTISLISAIWLKRPVYIKEVLALVLGLGGVALATFPLLQNSYVTASGLLIMAISILAYSFGTVYYSQVKWDLPRLSINSWQILFGGIFLLPFTFITFDAGRNHFDVRFWVSVAWLVLPVSILAVQLWLLMIHQNAVKASIWLFLCPIFGFVFSYLFLKEPITAYTFAGTAFVIAGLYLAQQQKFGNTTFKKSVEN